MKNDSAERLVKILRKDDSGIPNSVSEILKQDLLKLFSEYFDLKKDGVGMLVSTENNVIKIRVEVVADSVKNVRILC